MSKITMDNLSDNLKAYMDSLGLSEEQVLELIKNNISGDLEGLNTSDKSSLVAAINELFQNANNGKELIATAIGEPLNSSDTFSAMSTGINGLLSTFKTNMMNSGVMVESSDKFKQLIDKIKGLTEGEGNKGIQYAEGICDDVNLSSEGIINVNHNIPTHLNFTPNLIIIGPLNFTEIDTTNGYNINANYKNVFITNLNNTNFTGSGGYRSSFISNIKNISNDGFTLYYQGGYYSNAKITCKIDSDTHWYALGVGEEDTTLEDSLRDILGNKGVEVTPEDDLASLITKVDNIEAAGEFSYNPQKTLTIPVQFYSTNPSNVIENNNLWYFSDVNNIVKSTIDSDYNIALQNTTTVTNMGKETLLTAYNNKLYTFLTNTLYIRNGDTYAIEKSVVCGANTTTIQVSNILKIILITTSDAVKIFDFNLNLITNIKVVANYATIYKKINIYS